MEISDVFHGIKKKDKLNGMQIIYFVCMLYHVLSPSFCWFTLGYPPLVLHFINAVTVISFFVGYSNSCFERRNQKVFFSVCLFLFIHAFLSSHKVSLGTAFQGFEAAIRFLFLLLRRDYVYIMAKKMDKVLCPIIAISTLFWILLFFNKSLISIGTHTFQQYTFVNYLFMVYDSAHYPDRFAGFTLEPGYFSLLLTCLLYFNRFRISQLNVKIYLMALLFTLSLGGFVLTFVAWFLTYTLYKTKEVKVYKICLRAVSFLLLAGAAYYYVTIYWNGGDNDINKMIVSRLDSDSEKGITGNNRYSEIGEIYFLSFAQTDDIWFGRGAEAYNQTMKLVEGYDDQSIRRFIICDGLIFTITMIICVFLLFKYKIPLRMLLPAYSIWLGDLLQHGVAFGAAFIWMTLIVYSMKISKDYQKSSLNNNKYDRFR